MKNKLFWVIIVVFVFLVVVFYKIQNYDLIYYSAQKDKKSEKEDYINEDEIYYTDLSKQCNNDCCRASVDKMRKTNAIVSDNGKCRDGYFVNRLLCTGSYSWCVKNIEPEILKKEMSFDKKIQNYLLSQEDFLIKKDDENLKLCDFLNLDIGNKKIIYDSKSFPFNALVSCVEYKNKNDKFQKVGKNHMKLVRFELKQDLKTVKLDRLSHEIIDEKSIDKEKLEKARNLLVKKLDKKLENVSLEKMNNIWTVNKGDDGKIKLKIIQSSYVDNKLDVQDSRKYQHGINFLKLSDNFYELIWSSKGNAVFPNNSKSLNSYNIYYSFIDSIKPQIVPKQLLKTSLGQGFVSSAVNSKSDIFVLAQSENRDRKEKFEIGKLYGDNMINLSEEDVILKKGHGAHVSSLKDKFLVAYSSGWIEGRGLNNEGIGNDVALNIYDKKANLIDNVNIVAGEETRDWWPIVTSSKENALILWQRFLPNKNFAKLMFTIYDPEKKVFDKKITILKDDVMYYSYSVTFLKDLDRFLVLGNSSENKGFALLLDKKGNVLAQDYALTPVVREVYPAVKSLNKNEVKVVYPANNDKIATLSITSKNISSEGVVSVGYDWDISGTSGIFLDNNDLYFVSLSADGLKQMQLRIYEKK